MVTLNLYVEDALTNLQEIDTSNQRADALEKMIFQIKAGPDAQRLKNEIHLALSICYLEMAICIYLAKKDNDTAYHLALMGSGYLKMCQRIDKDTPKYSDFIKTQMRYCFLRSLLVTPEDSVYIIHHIPSTEESVDFMPNINSPDDLFIIIDLLHREGLMDPAMSAYQGLIAIAGFTQPGHQLEKDTRLILMTDALKRLTPSHPCYQELQTSYTKYLKELTKTPLTLVKKNIFMISKWYMQALMSLCDKWFILQVKNDYLFQPSRLFQSVSNINFSKQYTHTETFPPQIINDNSPISFNLSITEQELIKFIGHLHPLQISVGTSPASPAFVIDLALQKHGYIDKDFRYAGDNKLKELADPKTAFYFFQTIKDLAAKYGVVLREDEIKQLIPQLYSDIKIRVGATNFFRQFYFEALPFNTAFYLLNKSLASIKNYLMLDFPLFADAYNETKALVSNSFYIHMENHHILSTNVSSHEKLGHHKNYCERLIQYVVANKTQVLLQIQAYDLGLSHAIYGILEPIIEQDTQNVIGIQLVISNGGLGCEHHTSHKSPKRKPTFGERMPMTWKDSDWEFYVDHAASPPPAVKYKGVKINDISNEGMMKSFCYYLMICCGGYYLTHQNKICTTESFINAIYDPKLHAIKNKDWIKQPNLDSLVSFDIEQYMPQQIMGNCTVYNAMYAIKYAKNLNALQIWYLTYVIEAGIDELCSLLKMSPSPSLHSNPGFSS